MFFPRFSAGFLALCLLLSGCEDGLLPDRSADEVVLEVAYAEYPSTYSPLSYEAKNRKFLSNLYEPLLRFDSTFNMESMLAVSWGRLTPLTWDFRLRPDVYFHDGRPFTSADVVFSLNAARGENSELSSLLSTLDTIKAVGDDRLEITTLRPDPLLLNRLTYVYIFPEDTVDFALPIGTGPYRVKEFSPDELRVERFDDYWGSAPYFSMVRLRSLSDPNERVEVLKKGDVQVLANVPPQSVEALKDEGLKLAIFPSLESSYLVLNQAGIFENAELRAAVWNALSTDYTDRLGGGYLRPLSQYAATGIEGYHSAAPVRERNLEKALENRARVEGELTVTLDVPLGLEALGAAIASDLAEIEIKVDVQALSPVELQEKIVSGHSEFYFFGWKYDLADNADFFEAVVHSPENGFGAFNGTGYRDEELDRLMETAESEFVLENRRALLRQVGDRLWRDQVIIPLFESQNLYAFQASILWNLRLDGQLLFSDLIRAVL